MKTKQLDKQLAAYSTAAGAVLLGASSASGAIIHTDLSAVILSQSIGTTTYNVDVNGDTKFTIEQFKFDTSWSSGKISNGTANASWVGNNNASAGVNALNSGANVKTNTSWGQLSSGSNWNLASSNSSSSITGGNFLGTTGKYIGIRFADDGNTHYGWIQLDIASDASEITINGWAYNDVANGAITAGQEAVPEPSSLALLAAGAVGIRLLRKRYDTV